MASSEFLGVVGDVITTTSHVGGRSSSRRSHHHHHHRTSRSSHSKKHRSSSRSRSRSRSRYRMRSRSASRHGGSRSAAGGFFGFGDGGSEVEVEVEGSSKRSIPRAAGLFGLPFLARSGFFGRTRSSFSRRSPRPGFIHRAVKQLKRLLRDLTHHAKRHPWKVFFLIIVPLFGSLGALLARFGLRIPASIENMLGMASRAKGDPFGTVNNVVRMAGNLGSGGGNCCRGARVQRARY